MLHLSIKRLRPTRATSKRPRRLTYANVVSSLALFLVLAGGSAYAANHYLITSTKQIKPSVLKSLRGASGPAGQVGAPGATGPAGTPGATGAAGTNGATGATGPVGPNGAISSFVGNESSNVSIAWNGLETGNLIYLPWNSTSDTGTFETIATTNTTDLTVGHWLVTANASVILGPGAASNGFVDVICRLTAGGNTKYTQASSPITDNDDNVVVVPVSATLGVAVTSGSEAAVLSCEVNDSSYSTASEADPAEVEDGSVSAVQVSSLGD